MRHDLTGLTLAQVASKLGNEHSFRVVSVDDVPRVVTHDLRSDRVSLEMKDGVVAKWYMG